MVLWLPNNVLKQWKTFSLSPDNITKLEMGYRFTMYKLMGFDSVSMIPPFIPLLREEEIGDCSIHCYLSTCLPITYALFSRELALMRWPGHKRFLLSLGMHFFATNMLPLLFLSSSLLSAFYLTRIHLLYKVIILYHAPNHLIKWSVTHSSNL